MLLLLGTGLATAQSNTTYERGKYTKIEDLNSSSIYDDAAKQSVIQILDTAVALDKDDVWTSDEIKLQYMLTGYPTKANLIVDLTAGSFSAVWRENYGETRTDNVHLQNAQHPDSGQVIVPTTAPFSTAGVWVWPTDFLGGSGFTYYIKAEEDGTVLRNIGVQLMP